MTSVKASPFSRQMLIRALMWHEDLRFENTTFDLNDYKDSMAGIPANEGAAAALVSEDAFELSARAATQALLCLTPDRTLAALTEVAVDGADMNATEIAVEIGIGIAADGLDVIVKSADAIVSMTFAAVKGYFLLTDI